MHACRSTLEDPTWQVEAWEMYDETGELHYAANWVAKSLSRVRLVAARAEVNTDPEPLEDGPAVELVADLAGGVTGQAQLLSRAGLHLFVVGETKIVGRTIGPDDDPEEDWRACANGELTEEDGHWVLDDGSGPVELREDDLVIRAWQPHGAKYYLADSPVQSALPILRELRDLTMHVSAQLDSRLTGAGILYVPSELSFPAPPTTDPDDPDAPRPTPVDEFRRELTRAILTARRDRDNASALVPIIVPGPAEYADAIRLIKFWSELDDNAERLRTEARRRLALALDLPPEIILGSGDVNHWSAWQLAEEAITIGVAPLATVICHALTIGWMRPALEQMNVPNPEDYLVWYDTSPLEIRGDRSQAAVAVYDRGELSGDALRRENGFDAGDRPAVEELQLRALLEAAKSDSRLLAQLDHPAVRIVQQAPSPRVEADTEPTGRGLPQRPVEPPERTENAEPPVTAAASPCSMTSLLPMCEVAVYRGLELVGKRLNRPRSRRAQLASIPPHEVHTVIPYDRDPDWLLEGAWRPLELTVDREMYECLQPMLDRYVRRLLNTTQPHRREELAKVLADSGCGCDG